MTFNAKHKSFQLIDSIYIKLTKVEKSKYYILQVSSLFVKKIESFRILRKVNNLAYKLKFSNIMKIHNVIFIVHLKQIKLNFFVKTIFSFLSILINNDKLYVVEKIFRKKIKNKEIEYVVKWKNYDEVTW